MAAAGVRLGPQGRAAMGGIAAPGDRQPRETFVQHREFWGFRWTVFHRRPRRVLSTGFYAHGSWNAAYSVQVPGVAGTVDRVSRDRGIPGCSSPAAAPSRADVIRLDH